jgi:flagellar biosynthetic protein FlhB
MANTTAERTEKPTGRRLTDARKRGQVARSRVLGEAASLAAVLAVLSQTGMAFVQRSGSAVTEGLARVGDRATTPIDSADLPDLAWWGGQTIALTVGPVALASVLAIVAIHTLQGGWNVASEAIRIDWARLSPASGFKRLGFARGGLDTLMIIGIAAALVAISLPLLTAHLEDSVRIARLGPWAATLAGWSDADRLLRRAVIVLAAVGIADYGLQRWRLMTSLKMTKQEVQDDTKMTEGNPEIRARVRRVQRQMVRRRMLADVARATVVITNPTEYAVALLYERHAMAAPKVVAKGRGPLAARIKAVAREHDRPIVENVPLAQALYKGAEVGDTIPAALFDAVAEVLAYLIRLKQLVLQ